MKNMLYYFDYVKMDPNDGQNKDGPHESSNDLTGFFEAKGQIDQGLS